MSGIVRVTLDDAAVATLVDGLMVRVRGVTADGIVEVEIVLADNVRNQLRDIETAVRAVADLRC